MSDFNPRHHAALARLVNERDRYRGAVRQLAHAVKAARESFYARSRGGQHVPFHGDFAAAGPSVLSQLEWWTNYMTEAELLFPPDRSGGGR